MQKTANKMEFIVVFKKNEHEDIFEIIIRKNEAKKKHINQWKTGLFNVMYSACTV